MFSMVSGALGALSVLGNLLQPLSKTSTDNTAAAAQAFAPGAANQPAASYPPATGSSCSGGCAFSPSTMASLIDLQSQQSTGASNSAANSPLKTLFNQLDANGDGQISQAELQQALGSDNTASADALFAKLDADGNGGVSQDELKSALRAAHHHRHHHRPPPVSAAQALDPLLAAAGSNDPTATQAAANVTA